MLIQHGVIHKKFLGIKRKIKAPSFHAQFGTTAIITGDFNLDSGLRVQPSQNVPDTIFNTPAQPEGCGGEGIASVMGDYHKVLYSPWYSYSQICIAEGQSTNSPCDLSFILNEPVTSGVQDLQGNIVRSPQWYEVTPLNGSLFQGIVSAMRVGLASVAFASTWYQSFDTPVNGVVAPPSGLTSGHFWKFCGVKTINGVEYLIAAPWLGDSWGANGFCYMSQAIVDSLGGQAFTPNASANTEPIPVSVATILESLINFMKKLLSLEGGTESAWERWEAVGEKEVDYVLDFIENELTKKPMPEETPIPIVQSAVEPVPVAPQAPVATVPPSVDTLLPWNTTTSLSHENYHNVRVICDLEGLTPEQKDILTACVWVESEFNTHAKLENMKNGQVWSTDNGICQWNTYFHGSEITPDQAINDPEFAVRLMCSYWKAGKETQWVSFTSGEYKAHLGKTL